MNFKLENLKKQFGKYVVFENFNIEFEEQAITCILGQSGCGKTTLLNIIGEILKPDSGKLIGFNGRKISYVFQEPRLLPWKTVRENIKFVLESEFSEEEKKERVDALIKNVKLGQFENYYPAQLSGGMKQRVAIARAFVCPSDIILMDEPFIGLDLALKRNLLSLLAQIWRGDKRTVIFVTHNVDEALLLGNQIVVLGDKPTKIIGNKRIDQLPGDRNLKNSYFNIIRKELIALLDNMSA